MIARPRNKETMAPVYRTKELLIQTLVAGSFEHAFVVNILAERGELWHISSNMVAHYMVELLYTHELSDLTVYDQLRRCGFNEGASTTLAGRWADTNDDTKCVADLAHDHIDEFVPSRDDSYSVAYAWAFAQTKGVYKLRVPGIRAIQTYFVNYSKEEIFAYFRRSQLFGHRL